MKLTNNFLILPKSSLDVRQLLLDSGRNSDEAAKTIANTGISSIGYAYPKLLSEFVLLRYGDDLQRCCSVLVTCRMYLTR